MRQDQLIIQLISLMDSLLKKENMDLKLTPYKVILEFALRTTNKFVDFIRCWPQQRKTVWWNKLIRRL